MRRSVRHIWLRTTWPGVRPRLTVDDSKFSPDGCVFDADGIYWSFIGFDGDVAVLNGCGETYRFARPDADDDDLIEWIAFERY